MQHAAKRRAKPLDNGRQDSSPERATELNLIVRIVSSSLILNTHKGNPHACTHLSLHYHLVFSTKERFPLIRKEWRADLHAYLGGIIKGLNGVPLAIGGVEDHAHLLVGLRSTHRLDYVLRDLKADSSGWVHKKVSQRKFQWQSGYLGLTVSPSQVERVRRYIQNQERHHKRKSFQEEYLELLKLSGIEYDDRYLW